MRRIFREQEGERVDLSAQHLGEGAAAGVEQALLDASRANGCNRAGGRHDVGDHPCSVLVIALTQQTDVAEHRQQPVPESPVAQCDACSIGEACADPLPGGAACA